MTTRQGGSRKRLQKTFGFAAILIGLFVSMFGLGADLVDASTRVANPVPYNGNLDCADFGFAYEFKIDEQPTAKTYTLADPKVVTSGAVPAGTTVTISNVELVNGRMEFDWSSNQAWGALLVKQSNEGLRYPYNPAASDDQNVQTVAGNNQGGISHITFCGPGPVAPPTADVTLAKVTTGANAPAAGTSFTFTVTCQSGTVPSSPVQIASGAAAVTVADNVVLGSTCTITETANQGAASTVYTVNGTAQPAGAQVVVTVTSAQNVVVTATNDFPAPPPPPPPPPPPRRPGPVVVNPPVVNPPVVEPEVITPPVVTPPVVEPEVITPPAPPTDVAGVVVPRQLPRTGTTTMPLLQIGLGLVLLGVGVLLFGRERTVLV